MKNLVGYMVMAMIGLVLMASYLEAIIKLLAMVVAIILAFGLLVCFLRRPRRVAHITMPHTRCYCGHVIHGRHVCDHCHCPG